MLILTGNKLSKNSIRWSNIQTEERQIDRGCDFNFEDANVQ